ncbi:MAG: VOC family protein [Clostridia bacterium]
MPLINGIHHVAIKTMPSQFDRVVWFYTKLLQLTTVRSWGDSDNRGTMLSTGDNSVLEIISDTSANTSGIGAYRHIAFSVNDVDQLTEIVRNQGFIIQVEPKDVTIQCEKPYNLRIAFCRGVLDEQIEFFHEKSN